MRLLYGGVPEWPKGADCKSVVFDFDGSNPSPSTIFPFDGDFESPDAGLFVFNLIKRGIAQLGSAHRSGR